jgi:hypothetical protein
MAGSLEGVRLKVARASEHLDALAVEASNYLNSTPFEVVGQRQPDGETLPVFKVNHHPPLRLSLLLGDILHNLRSSLDHLTWQLVLEDGGTPGRRTSFPILLKKGRQPLDIAGGVSAQALTFIESLQPYNSPSGSPHEHPLQILSVLNNIDKHRTFNIAVLSVSEVLQADLLTADGTGIYMTFQFPTGVGKDGPITDGAIVGRPPFAVDADKNWRIGIQSRLALQEPQELKPMGTPSLHAVAESLLVYVRDEVIPGAEPLFS